MIDEPSAFAFIDKLPLPMIKDKEMNNEPVAKVTAHGIYLEYPLGLNLKIGTKLYTHPVKELTNNEMRKVINEIVDGVTVSEMVTFLAISRAILRKAQEK